MHYLEEYFNKMTRVLSITSVKCFDDTFKQFKDDFDCSCLIKNTASSTVITARGTQLFLSSNSPTGFCLDNTPDGAALLREFAQQRHNKQKQSREWDTTL